MAKLVTVVDDDREVRVQVSAALQAAGYQVVTAANGLRLISSLHVDHPNLILLDVMMSWINGFELCLAVKKNPQFASIPIAFMSGQTRAEDFARGKECGAVAYFPKPLDVSHLVDQVRELIGPP